MKFRVTMKDPDTLHDAIQAAAHKEVWGMAELDRDEKEAVYATRREKVANICVRWFQHGEYLTVEIDTDAGACVVVETP